MKRSRARLASLIIFTLGLMAVILFATVYATRKINAMAQQQCFDELYDEAHAMGKEIEQNVASNRQQLELIASVAADYDDMTDPELWAKLRSYIVSGMLSRIEILLPDDTVVTQDGRVIDASGKLSFADEAAQGEHITGRSTDLESDDVILRHFVPVQRGGNTVAMLYGVAVLKDMPSKLIDKPYNGEAAVYVIDGETGDFLMDTWHEELGNIWEFGGRKMADGYDNDALKQGIADGESNYVVFVSQTIGSYLYFYYTPLGVNSWSVALSVPEDVVFRQASGVSDILDGFFIVELLCFIALIALMLNYVRMEITDARRRVEQTDNIYDVENLLFTAHENSDRVSDALERVAAIAGAEQASYWMVAQKGYDISYLWHKQNCSIRQSEFASQRKNAHNVMDYFTESGADFYSASGERLREYIPDAPERGITEVLAVPIEDSQGDICGVLTTYNPKYNADPKLLRNLGVSFGMFCQNMRGYHSVKEQGEKDLLTGLYNRNRYELDAADCKDMYKETLACVYADANGLHELNNSFGHVAGDKMLQTVANVLVKHFGDSYTYRIGGDEFLVFAADMPAAEVRRLAALCAEEIESSGYRVAIGVGIMQGSGGDAKALVETAEQAMYADKQSYYAGAGRAVRC